MATPFFHVDVQQPAEMRFNRARVRRAFVTIGQRHMRDARRLVMRRARSAPGENPGYQTGRLARSIGYMVPRASKKRAGFMTRIAPNQRNGKGNRMISGDFYGVADNSYLDSETLHTSAYVLRKLKSVITSKYGRHKLASDGTRFGPGQAIVTPAVIKGELLATYRQLERAGIVENYELFKQYLVVERDASDPNRLNTLFPPDYVNQLRVFAVVNQFRLQYSEESA